MANNYKQTSFMVLGLGPREKAWMTQKLEENDRKMREEDDWDNYTGISYKLETDKNGTENIWFYAEESFMADNLAHLLQDFLKEHRPKDCISFCWADTCSKMRIDEFTGGGVFITAKRQTWIVPDAKIYELEKKHRAKHNKSDTT